MLETCPDEEEKVSKVRDLQFKQVSPSVVYNDAPAVDVVKWISQSSVALEIYIERFYKPVS